MAKTEALPENLRCNRTDGRTWRCNRRVMEDKKLCEIHYLQGRHRQHKQKVPDSLKLERKPNKPRNQETGKKQKGAKMLKKKRSTGESLEKLKLKRGDSQLESIREFLKTQLDKKEREMEQSETEKEDLTTELQNGVMAVTPSPIPQEFDNVGSCNVKLGQTCSSFKQRGFRSKNVEPMPITPLQDAIKLGRGKRKKCHWCPRSSFRALIQCTSCQKQFFCEDCIEERCFDKQEVKTACPICLGTCDCRACSTNQPKCLEYKGSYKDIKKVEQLRYLIHMLLPVLEEMNLSQNIELEIEAKIKGKVRHDMNIPQIKLGCKKLNYCNNCKGSIVDFHRSCRSCSYNLCLSCCRMFRIGQLCGSTEENKIHYPNRRRDFIADGNLPRKKQSTSKQNSCKAPTASPIIFENYKVCDSGRISCPPNSFGGCGENTLDLRCIFSFGWTNRLQLSIKDILGSYNFPGASHFGSCYSLCKNSGHKANRTGVLQEAAWRDNQSDNFIYYPTVQDLHVETLEHFQKHWTKGHPVIVRNLIQTAVNLSWDPVSMFCTFLGQNNVKYQNGKEAMISTKCLDWCEVEICSKKIYTGSLEGQIHSNAFHDMVKLKGCLPSIMFQEHFPVHYAEIMHSLPLKEYINPKCGLLNLAVKLPNEMPNSDLGPSILISYNGPEELMQANFLTRLSYDSYDVVNILAHATDVPISTEELTRLKALLRMYKKQSHSKSVVNATAQPLANQLGKIPSLHRENLEVTGKLSFHIEDTGETVSEDLVGQDPKPDGDTKALNQSPDSHRGSLRSAIDLNTSNADELDPEYDSEATILDSGIRGYEDSEDENFFQDNTESSIRDEENTDAASCSAQWDIFRREDVPKLLEYLIKHSKELGQENDTQNYVVHPILDQRFFLGAFHKMRLKKEFNIEPWTFEQKIGEAVFIPAGCPYQIRKLKSHVNVMLEFISPESAPECIKLADELRILPLPHKAKRKIPEVRRMTLNGISDAIEELSNLTSLQRVAPELTENSEQDFIMPRASILLGDPETCKVDMFPDYQCSVCDRWLLRYVRCRDDYKEIRH